MIHSGQSRRWASSYPSAIPLMNSLNAPFTGTPA